MTRSNEDLIPVRDSSAMRCVAIAILSVTLGVAVSCGARPTKPPPSSVAREASHIRTAWEEQESALERRSKDYPEKRLELLLTLLAGSSAEEIKTESERVIASSQAYSELSEYDKTLIQALVVRVEDAKDRTGLVSMLARKAPASIAANPLELYLSVRDADNILIIFDSYQQANSPDNKKLLMRALRGSFRDQREQFSNDEEFLRASREWYLANRSKLKVNPYYYPFEETASAKYLFVVEN